MWASGFPSAIGWIEQVLDGHGGRMTTFVGGIPPVYSSTSKRLFWPCDGQVLVSLPPWASPEAGVRSEDW